MAEFLYLCMKWVMWSYFVRWLMEGKKIEAKRKTMPHVARGFAVAIITGR